MLSNRLIEYQILTEVGIFPLVDLADTDQTPVAWHAKRAFFLDWSGCRALSACVPKVIVPMQISLTTTPLPPNLRFSIPTR